MVESTVPLEHLLVLHKVRIRAGRADLSTRYVRTEKLLREREAGRALFGAYRNPFTDDASVAGIDRSTANTSVIFHAGRLMALKEAARPVLIDPDTLDSVSTYDFDGRLRSELIGCPRRSRWCRVRREARSRSGGS